MHCITELVPLLLMVALSTCFAAPMLKEQKVTATDDNKVVCYFPNWSQYRPGIGTFTVHDIDATLCTHLIYAFAKIDEGPLELAPYEWNDFTNYPIFNNLKLLNPSLKTLLSVGGATMGSTAFIYVSSTQYNRKQFSKNVVDYLREHGFDGVDIDWEFPSYSTRDNLSLLLKALRKEFKKEAILSGNEELMLTAALGVGDKISAYDVPEISKHIDFANIMTYNFHGSWESWTGLHSPLFGRFPADTLSHEYAVNSYLSAGLPSAKLILGIPSYGQSFTLCNPADHGVGACSTGAGDPSQYLNSYFEICMKLQLGLFTREYDIMQQAPYVYAHDQWISYDDVQSIGVKMQFLHQKSLGGAMFWDISMDDFDNHCGDGHFPLINAAKSPVPSTVDPTTSSQTPTTTTPSRPSTIVTTPITSSTSASTSSATTSSPPSSPSSSSATSTSVSSPATSTPTPPSTPTPQPSTTPYVPEITCSFNGQYIRDPCDCGVFYHCSNGVPIKQLCPVGLHFDTNTSVCDFPGNANCVEIC